MKRQIEFQETIFKQFITFGLDYPKIRIFGKQRPMSN